MAVRGKRNPAPAVTGFEFANANFVLPRLAVGGDLSPNFRRASTQVAELVAAGITHIADLRSEWTDEALVAHWAPQLSYLHHPVADAGQVIDPAWFTELTTWVTAALRQPGTKVLVHCHMGVNRAPSAVLAVLLSQGMELRPALDAIRQARPIAVIDYARDALDWHLAATAADAKARRNARRRLGRWRGSNHLDAAAVIRAIRDTETRAHHWLLRLAPDEPAMLANLLRTAGEVAVGLAVDVDPPELCQFDEVLLAVPDGLVGRALVIGPVRRDGEAEVLPLVVEELREPVAVVLPRRLASWVGGKGANLRLLTAEQYRGLRPK